MALVTVFNQGFVYSLRNHIANTSSENTHPPIRLDLNIRQQAKSTSILVADVSVKTSYIRNRKGRSEVIEEIFDDQRNIEQ